MIDRWTLATIILMAVVTYLTRIGGYVLLGERALSPRATAILDSAPGCVLIAVIAPVFVSGQVADMVTLAITTAAATRLSLLPTVLIAIAGSGVARSLLA